MDDLQKRTVRSNTVLAILSGSLRSIAALASYGTLFQTFLVSLGFSSSDIYINTTIVQSALIIVTPLCAKWADKGNIIKRAALIQLPTAVLMLFYLPVCLSQDNSPATFWYLTGCCFMHVVVLSLYTVVDYKLPYFIFPVEGYGTMMSLSGVISNLISLGTGMLITAATAVMSFPNLMLIASITSCVMMLVSAWATYRLKMLIHADQMDASKIGKIKKKESVFTLFKMPLFARLAPANFLRGVSGAATSVMAAVALDLGYDEGVTTLLISVTSAVTLVGYAIFGVMSRKLNPRLIIGLGAVTILFLPLILLRGSSTLFLAVFAVVLFGRILVDVGVPFILRMAVPVDISGPYNAWRMIIYNAGFVLTTTVAAVIPVDALIVAGTVSQLFVGASYYYDKELRNRLQPGNINL